MRIKLLVIFIVALSIIGLIFYFSRFVTTTKEDTQVNVVKQGNGDSGDIVRILDSDWEKELAEYIENTPCKSHIECPNKEVIIDLEKSKFRKSYRIEIDKRTKDWLYNSFSTLAIDTAYYYDGSGNRIYGKNLTQTQQTCFSNIPYDFWVVSQRLTIYDTFGVGNPIIERYMFVGSNKEIFCQFEGQSEWMS